MSIQVANQSGSTIEVSVGLTQMLDKLDQAQMPIVDFDQLKEQARALLAAVAGQAVLEEEMIKLRKDYQARIAGMLKAVAAVSRRQGALSEALSDIERLEPMDAESLILAYGRVTARFRDTFRSSFAPAGGSSSTVRPQEYK